MSYGSRKDPYCYPDTTILRNKHDICDPALLEQFELAKYIGRVQTPWPPGKLDKPHYYALHRHFFQDVYDWAGKPRTVRIAKGGNMFCYPEYIDGQIERLFADLKAKRHLVGLPVDDSPDRPPASSPTSTPYTPSERAMAEPSLPSCACFASMPASDSTRRSWTAIGSSAP